MHSEIQTYTVEIRDKENQVKESATGEEVFLYYTNSYKQGDRICIKGQLKERAEFVWLSFDDAIGKSLVYLTGDVTYMIPFDEKRLNLSPKAFYGENHLIFLKKAKEFETASYRNLAVNVCDQHKIKNLYPHASANVETRGEAVFAAQNAIDGITYNTSHGNWPYGSWGINQRADATFTLDFGREIKTNCIVLYTRADFPHDAYWTKGTITFSDGSSIEVSMEKSTIPHTFQFETKSTNHIILSNLIKSSDESLFPALTQIEVYGFEVI